MGLRWGQRCTFVVKSHKHMATSEKLLSSCTLKNVDKTFKTSEVSNLPSLDSWLAMPADISDFEQQSLLRSQKTLIFNVARLE